MVVFGQLSLARESALFDYFQDDFHWFGKSAPFFLFSERFFIGSEKLACSSFFGRFSLAPHIARVLIIFGRFSLARKICVDGEDREIWGDFHSLRKVRV